MSDFSNELHLLPSIFKDKFFVIPDYQRGYAWGDEQVQELLSDIEHQIFDGLDNKHYTGTLVLLNKSALQNSFQTSAQRRSEFCSRLRPKISANFTNKPTKPLACSRHNKRPTPLRAIIRSSQRML